MLVTSWCLTLWCFLCKPPLIVCLPSFCITERKSQCNPQKTMDSTTRPNPSRLPNISQLTVSKQCKKNTGSLHLCSLSPSPDCEPQLYEPLDSLWKGDMVLEARAVLSSLPTWGLKLYFYFLQTVSYLFIQLRMGRERQDFGGNTITNNVYNRTQIIILISQAKVI